MALKLFGGNQPSAWNDNANTIAPTAAVNEPEPGTPEIVHSPSTQFAMGKTDLTNEIDPGEEARLLMGIAEPTNRFYRDVNRDKIAQYIEGLGDTSQMDDATLRGHATACADFILPGLSDRAFGEETPKMSGKEFFQRMVDYANGNADALKTDELKNFDALDPVGQLAAAQAANKGKLGVGWNLGRMTESLSDEFRKGLTDQERADYDAMFGPDLALRESAAFKEKTKDLFSRYKAAVTDKVDQKEIDDYRTELERKSILHTLASKNFRWLSDESKKFISVHIGVDNVNDSRSAFVNLFRNNFDKEAFLKLPEAEQETVLAAIHLAREDAKANRGYFLGLRPGGVDGMTKGSLNEPQTDAMRVIYGAESLLPRLGSELWNGTKTAARYLWAKAFYDKGQRDAVYKDLELDAKIRNAMDQQMRDPESIPGRVLAAYGDNFGFQIVGGIGTKGAQIANRGVAMAKMGKAKGLFGWFGGKLDKAVQGVKAAEAMEGASEAVKAEVALLKAHDKARKAYELADKAVDAARTALENARAGKGAMTADKALASLEAKLAARAVKAEETIQAFRKINGGIPATKEAIEGAEFYNKILAARKAAAAAGKNLERAGTVVKGAFYTGENALWFGPFYDQQIRQDVANGIPIEMSIKTRWTTMLACGWAEKAVFTRMAQGRMTPQMLTATSGKAISQAAGRVKNDLLAKVQGEIATALKEDFKTLEAVVARRLLTDAAHGVETGINVTAQSMLDEVLNKMGQVYEKNAELHGMFSKETWLDTFRDVEWVQTCLDVLDNSTLSAPGFALLSPVGMRMNHRMRQNNERRYQEQLGNTRGLPWQNANINTDQGLLAAKDQLDAAELAARQYIEMQTRRNAEQKAANADGEVGPEFRGEDRKIEQTVSEKLRGVMTKVFEIGADTRGKRTVERIMDECKVDRPTAELLLGVANDYAALESPLQEARVMYEQFMDQVGVRSPALIAREVLRGTVAGARNVRMLPDGISFDIDVDGKTITFGYRTMENFTAEDLKEFITDNSPIKGEYEELCKIAPDLAWKDDSGKIVHWDKMSTEDRKAFVTNQLQGLSKGRDLITGKSAGRLFMTEADGTHRYIDVDELIKMNPLGAQQGTPRHETAHSILRVAERLGYFTQADKKIVAEVIGIDTESARANEIVDGGVPQWVVDVDEALAEGYREHTMGISTPAWSRLAENYDGVNELWGKLLSGIDNFINSFGRSVTERPEWRQRSAYNPAALDKFYQAMFTGDVKNLGNVIRELTGQPRETKTGNAALDAYNKAVEEYTFQKALAASGNTTADVEGAKKRMNAAMKALREANKESGAVVTGVRGSLGSFAGININVDNQDFVSDILDGRKTIETRQTNSLDPYVGKDVGIVRTRKGEQAAYVGRMEIGKAKVYRSAEEFDADYEKHRIPVDSPYHFSKRAKNGVLFGYPLNNVRKVSYTPLGSRGIVARDIRSGVSVSTRNEFAADKETKDWIVHIEPTYIRNMEAVGLEDHSPVTEKTDNNSVEKAIQDLFSSFDIVENENDGYKVVFNRSDAGKMMMQSGVDMRTFAPQLKHLFETSVHSFDQPQLKMDGHKYRKNVVGFKHYINKVTMEDGRDAYVRFTVREETNGRKGVHAATVSDVRIYENKDADISVPANKSGGVRVFTDKIIAKFLDKGQSYQGYSFSPGLVDAYNLGARGSLGVPYQGSKNRIGANIVNALPDGDRLVDGMSGGGAVTHAALLSGKYRKVRMNDINPVGQNLFLQGVRGEWADYKRTSMTEDEFAKIKGTPEALPWSYNGLGRNLAKNGTDGRDKASEQIKRVKSLEKLKNRAGDIEATESDYREIKPETGDVIYFDIPYEGTDQLAYRSGKFDKSAFVEWAKGIGYPVFVSEYSMPEGWSEIASFDVPGMKGGNRVEKLFVQNEFAGNYQDVIGSKRYAQPSDGSTLPAERLSSQDESDVDAVKVSATVQGIGTRGCLVSGLEASGMKYSTDKNGRLQLTLPNGKKVTEKSPATADDLIESDSMLMHLIDLGIKYRTVGSTPEEGMAFKRNVAAAYAACFNLAAKWGNTPDGISVVDTMWRWIADETFKAIKSNSDKQYGTSVDMLTICKKTDMLMQVVSEYMKREKRGAMPTDIMNLYLKTGAFNKVKDANGKTVHFQTPCPVCYVFSRWIRAGYDRQTAWEAQQMYADALKQHDPNTAEGKSWWKKEYAKYYLPDAKEQNEKQKARAADIKKAKDVLALGYQAFDKAMRSGNKEEADRLNREMADAFEVIRTADIAGWIKYCVYDVDRDIVWNDFKEVPSDILFDFRAAVDITNNYPALKRFYGSKGSAGGKAIETEARNDLGDIVTGIATDGNIETYERWSPEYEAQLRQQMEERVPDPKKPGKMKKSNRANSATATFNARNWLKVAYQAAPGSKERTDALKQFESQFKSALAKSIRQRIIGGQRFYSWSDSRMEFGFDMMMNLMQIQLLGDSIQSYSKQLEGAELLVKNGAYNNGSLMGKGHGVVDAKPGEAGAVNIGTDESPRWVKLDFSDIQGIKHDALFELNKRYDKSGNILVGMNDDHIIAALRDERIFFIIPWHASGLAGGTLDYMLTSLGEDAHGAETDYSPVQSEKFLANATPDEMITSLWNRAAKNGSKFKSCIKVENKLGLVTKSQLDYRALRQAILLGKASQEQIDLAMKDEFLSQIVTDLQRGAEEIGGKEADSTYVNKALKIPMLKMASNAVEALYPYEYWDRKSTYGTASVNSARYLEYCRRLGVLPKFSGIVIEKGKAKQLTLPEDRGGAAFGNFTNEANYWKVLIDRRMYANGKNADGSWKDFASGKYQHTTKVAMDRNFSVDDINPVKLREKWGNLISQEASPEAVGMIVDEVQREQKSQGYSLSGIRGSLGVPPGLIKALDTDTLMTMAAAGRIAKGGNEIDGVRQDVENRVRAIYEGASEEEIGNRITAIMSGAEREAKQVRTDFQLVGGDAEVMNRMTQRQLDRYLRGLEKSGIQGLAQGATTEGARQELDRRVQRKIDDSIAAQTGIAVNELETGYGIDLAETLVNIHDIENQAAKKRKEESPDAEDDVDVPPELAVPLTPEETAEAERRIRSLVEDIKNKAWEQTEEAQKKREERKRRAEESEDDADDEGAGEAEGSSEADLAKFIIDKQLVDLRNPEHFAKFIAILAENKWKEDHGITGDSYIWADPVALQHLRMTAVNVYDALARKLMYSSKRETAMESLAKIEEAPTYDGVLREMEFAGRVIAQGMVRETASELVKDLEQLLTQAFGASGRFKQNEEDIHRKVTGRTELWARDVKKVLRWGPEKVAREIDKLRERMQGVDAEFLLAGRDPNSSKQFDKDLRMIAALQEFGGMLYKPLGEITDARVKILDRLDADKVAEEAEAREVRTKQMAAVLGSAFDSGRKMAFDETKLSAKIGNYFQEHLDFKHLLQDLMRFCKDPAVRQAAAEYIDNLQHDVQRRWDKARTEERVQMIQFQQAIKAIYGRSYHKVLADLLKHDERFDKFGQGEVNEDTGVATMVKMSKASAMQLYVAMQQKGYIGNIKANHREGQAIEIRKLLTKEDMLLLKWLGDWYDKERQGISDVSMKLFGLPVLAEESNYFPVKVMVPTQGLEKGSTIAWNPFPPSLTPRVKHGYDFDVRQNIISMWTDRMSQQAQWKQMAELGIELRGIFGRQSLQSTIRRCHGNNALKNVLSFVTDILNGSSGSAPSISSEKNTMDSMRSAAAVCALGGNLGVMLKQTTSIPAFGLEIGVGRTLQYLSTAFTPDGIRAMGAIWESDQRKNRWDSGNSEEVSNAIREALTTRNAFQTKVGDPLKRILKKSMITNSIGDCIPALVVGQGIYRSYIRQGLQAEEAMNRTWEIINRTQQTSQMDNQSMMQRRSKYGKLITQFQSTVRQYLAYEIASTRQLAAAKDLKSLCSWTRATFLTVGVLPSLYYLGGHLWNAILGREPDDQFLDDWVKSVLVSNAASLYGWGLLADGIASEVFFGKKGKEPMVPAMQIANTFVRGLSQLGYDLYSMAPLMWGDNPDADLDDFVDDALKMLKGMNAPVRDAIKVYENRIDN